MDTRVVWTLVAIVLLAAAGLIVWMLMAEIGSPLWLTIIAIAAVVVSVALYMTRRKPMTHV